LENLSGKGDKLHQELDREFIFLLLIQLNKLETIIASRPLITAEILERLFRKMLSILRVPFEGEPLSGLQVMGILETRLLDFKHVILLSMNEDVMPASQPAQSYIPYALRIAFRMPAREDMDAIYAYYFNRLLQRAEKVDLLYNSGSEGVRTGEMSRYLYQLIFVRGIQVIRPGMEVMARETPPVVISHNPDIERKLERYTLKSEKEKYLSPSAINTYIDCSLKFYLRYLAGIGEPDEVKEDLDAAGFGTVVHESIRILYSEIADRSQGIITKEELDQMIKTDRPRDVLKDVFLQYHFKGRKHASIEGRNIIVFSVMAGYLKKIIQTDLNVAPFTLVSVEGTYQRELTFQTGAKSIEIRLGGKIDRIDRVGDILRVIDYKTGDARMGFSSLEALFDAELGSRNGAALQTLFYAWLVAAEHPREEIMPGLYVMKALYGENFDPALTMGSHKQRTRIASFSGLEEEYIDLLKKVLGSMFDPSIPFAQTENDLKCRYCDFAAICNRTFID
ncbi:MAG: PD-(D/E)XK nuclease family protein, partial [Candidatus Atribacteria bacterium]